MLPILEREGKMRLGHEYEIVKTAKFTIHPKSGVSETFDNTNHDKILFLRLGPVHHYYHAAVSRLDGTDVIGEPTMRNYFKSKRYFIGPVSNRRFYDADGENTSSGSCYAFNYTMMEKSGILNLEKPVEVDPIAAAQRKAAAKTNKNEGEKDDLPF